MVVVLRKLGWLPAIQGVWLPARVRACVGIVATREGAGVCECVGVVATREGGVKKKRGRSEWNAPSNTY